ncbi:MAG: cysteine desulfurase [Candidatus Sumerlaeota bacterium]|nr:cysteine desulfurase [Candidatus Sumerlaeota bacterium]
MSNAALEMEAAIRVEAPPFDVAKVRADFPILRRRVYGKPLVYLDNAATTQKPRRVIEAITRFYEEECSNVHRGVHWLSQRATDRYEGARETVRRFLHAAEAREIVFTRGATESINLVANAYGRAHVGRDDEVLITAMEHHSNIVPWQILCEEKGARLRVAPIDNRGDLVLDEFKNLLSHRTKLVAVVHVSNALGPVNPVKAVVEMAHARGIPVLIDGAQAVPHLHLDVRALDCDFYVFSGHKIYGPTGIGALYGKAALLERMPPYQGGGDMILSVTFEKTLYNTIPYKFEAGTPDIAGAIGLGAALDYVESIGLPNIAMHERDLMSYATHALLGVPGLRIIGQAREKAGALSFTLDCAHPHDIGTIVDQEGVAIRTGHHCAQPVMERYGVPATARASFAMYNTREDVDALVQALHKVVELFG